MPKIVKRLAVVSMAAGTASMTIGCLVLCGWAFDIETLKRIVPGLVAMNPMTAIAFILAGLALLLLRVEQCSPTVRRIAQLLAVTIACIGLSKLVAILFGFNAGIDQLLFRTKLGDIAGGVPNRMAPNTALNFVVIGLALLLLDRPTSSGRWPAQWLVFIAGTLTMLPIMGYAYGITFFYGIGSFIPMAVHTAVTFLIIEFGILAARPRRGFMTLFTSDTSGGMIARRLLPSAIVVPIVLGWLRIAGQNSGLYNTEFGTALLTLANIAIFTLIITGSASQLYRCDAELRETERELRTAKDAAEAGLRYQQVLQKEVAVRTQALEEKTREQETFIYTVAHDLKAPLVTLQALATLLVEQYKAHLDLRAQGYLERISANVGKMHLLLADLLELSRIGRVDIEMSCVHLDVLLQDTLAELRPTLVARGAEVAIEGQLPLVFANPMRVTQIFMNLIDNAVKYTPPERVPRIQVMSTESGNYWEIVVRDNGIGIPVALRPKIFELFQRLPGGKALCPEGTGVGLTIVARAVATNGGKLWISSEEGGGSAFHFTLPKPKLAEQFNEQLVVAIA